MKQYLELHDLTYDGLGDFIESVAHEEDAFFLLGKAAAYIDVAFVLEQITQAEAEELLFRIQILLVSRPLSPRREPPPASWE